MLKEKREKLLRIWGSEDIKKGNMVYLPINGKTKMTVTSVINGDITGYDENGEYHVVPKKCAFLLTEKDLCEKAWDYILWNTNSISGSEMVVSKCQAYTSLKAKAYGGSHINHTTVAMINNQYIYMEDNEHPACMYKVDNCEEEYDILTKAFEKSLVKDSLIKEEHIALKDMFLLNDQYVTWKQWCETRSIRAQQLLREACAYVRKG